MKKNERDLYNYLYKNNPEAREFIDKHLKELPRASYNDVTDIHPEIIKVKNASVIIDNIQLLKSKKAQSILNDYYAGMKTEALLKKYKYADAHSLQEMISRYKAEVKKSFLKKLEDEITLEVKKLNDKVLATSIVKEMSLSNGKSEFKLKLARVPYKNKLNYHFTDDDVTLLINKMKIITPFLGEMEKKRIKRYTNLQAMTPKQFEHISEYCNKYRWVSSDGYLLSKVLDDALTTILSLNETDKLWVQ